MIKKLCKYFYKLYLENIKESHLRSQTNKPRNTNRWLGYIHFSPFRATRNTKLQNFQFKLSHIITATTTFLFKRGLKETELCTFCTETKESLLHLFWECTYTKINWFSLVTIYVFTVFRLLTDFVCLYNYEFWLSLCKIVRSSEILLLPLFFRKLWSEHAVHKCT